MRQIKKSIFFYETKFTFYSKAAAEDVVNKSEASVETYV